MRMNFSLRRTISPSAFKLDQCQLLEDVSVTSDERNSATGDVAGNQSLFFVASMFFLISITVSRLLSSNHKLRFRLVDGLFRPY